MIKTIKNLLIQKSISKKHKILFKWYPKIKLKSSKLNSYKNKKVY